MISLRYHNSGSAAPLAMLFTIVSMVFTVAYLKNSFNQAVLEEYRYAEHRALYAAEAGLNEVGVVVLPQLVTEDTLYTLREGNTEIMRMVSQSGNIKTYTATLSLSKIQPGKYIMSIPLERLLLLPV